MPFHRKIDFARICGVSSAQITMNVKRGKILVTSGGMIDDHEPINVLFRERHAELAAKRQAKGVKVQTEPDPPPAKQPTIGVSRERRSRAQKEKPVDKAMNDQIRNKMAVESKLKERQAERADAEARMMRLKEERISGQLIPSALIRPVISTHFQSLSTTYKQALEALISDISQKAKLNANQQAEIRKRMVEELNIAIDRGVSMTENAIDGIMDEYVRAKWKAA